MYDEHDRKTPGRGGEKSRKRGALTVRAHLFDRL
jgi:hypothetical protein